MQHAYTIDRDGGREPLDIHRALQAAAVGDLVVLPSALTAAGYLSVFTDMYLEEVSDLTSPAVAAAVRSDGLARLHAHLAPHEIAALLTRLDRRVAAFAVPLACALVDATTTEPRPPFFICARLWVRAQIPYRIVEQHPDLLAAEHLTGHLLPAGTHRDFWLTHPRGTLSLWGAIGPVRAGNSIALTWHDDPVGCADRDGDSESAGAPATTAPTVTPPLDPGDVLVFNADRLHRSVRNDTNETRVSMAIRIVLGRRLRYGPGSHWRPYYDARLLDTPLERLATVQSRLTTAAVRRWRARRAWARTQRRSIHHESAA